MRCEKINKDVDTERKAAGDGEDAIVGEYGMVLTGNFGKSISGITGESFSGFKGVSVSGKSGVSYSGVLGICLSGENGILAITYFDKVTDRLRLKVGYIGENGLKPNTPYMLDKNNEFLEVELDENFERKDHCGTILVYTFNKDINAN